MGGNPLLARAAEWLRWCGVDRVLAYGDGAAGAEDAHGTEAREAERLRQRGFAEVTRTARGWTRARS
ncbi:hypothetical protein [Streptomyces buecherae]|uniref:hypothetical protein n=1 Tax=Streptomyces buecherae TaxID=2763006 RepID=UPI00368029C1